MNTILTATFFFLCSFPVKAQTSSHLPIRFNAGAECIVPVSSGAQLSIGISGQVLFPVNKNSAVSFHSGILGLHSKVRGNDNIYRMQQANLIPVLGGFKFTISENVYAHGQAGIAFLNQGLGSHFCFGAAMGWYATPHLDFALGFNSYKGSGTAASIEWCALRSSYTF